MNEEKIWKYLDGELSEKEKTNLKRQLHEDDAVMKEFLEYKELDALLKGYSKTVPDQDVLIEFEESLELAFENINEPVRFDYKLIMTVFIGLLFVSVVVYRFFSGIESNYSMNFTHDFTPLYTIGSAVICSALILLGMDKFLSSKKNYLKLPI